MKTNEKLRGCEFYKTLATEIRQLGGIVTQDKMKDLINGISLELGYSKPGIVKKIEDKFLEIYHDFVEVAVVERSKEERGIGKNKTQRLISYVKDLSSEVIENTAVEYFKASRKMKPAVAREVPEKRERKVAVKKGDIVCLFLLLKKAESVREIEPGSIIRLLNRKTISPSWTEKWLERFKNVGITLCYTIVRGRRSWKLSFSENTVPVSLSEVAAYAKKNFGIQFAEVPNIVKKEPGAALGRPSSMSAALPSRFGVSKLKPRKLRTDEDTDYVLFVMAALGLRKRGPIDFALIGKYLRENRWRKIETSNMELANIVKMFPEILTLGHNNTYSVMNNERVLEEVRKLNPKNKKWVVPCVINSGLTIEDVRAWFSESVQVRPDVEMSCKVINIVLSRSIKDFLKLAGFKKKMRECDFFIGDEDLARKLDDEECYMEKIIEAELLGHVVRSGSHEANSVLTQLEEL